MVLESPTKPSQRSGTSDPRARDHDDKREAKKSLIYRKIASNMLQPHPQLLLSFHRVRCLQACYSSRYKQLQPLPEALLLLWYPHTHWTRHMVQLNVGAAFVVLCLACSRWSEESPKPEPSTSTHLARRNPQHLLPYAGESNLSQRAKCWEHLKPNLEKS